VPPPGVTRALQTALYPNPYFQSSIRVVCATAAACSRGLLFRSPRATQDNKIRVFVNSFSGAGLPVPGNQKRGQSGRASHPSFIVICLSSDAYRVARVSKYNRFGLPCKPPVSNRLQILGPADAQSSRPRPDVKPLSRETSWNYASANVSRETSGRFLSDRRGDVLVTLRAKRTATFGRRQRPFEQLLIQSAYVVTTQHKRAASFP
jgi:hypothetical protein